MSKLVTTGIDKLFYAVMTDENEETYGAVKRLEGAVELTVEATENLSSLAADNNNAYVTEEALGEITVSATIAAISTEDYCAIFGKKLAKTGGIIESANDVKPYVCLMAEKSLTGGIKEYVHLYKGKFSVPADAVKTKEGQVEFQTKQMEGKFSALSTGQWRYFVRSNDADFNAETWKTTWGTSVVKAEEKTSFPA